MIIKLFSFREKNNTLIISIISTVITLGAIYIYNFFPMEYESFLAYFIGIVYAFLFFLIGIYQNSMQRNFENKYEIFKNQYKNLNEYYTYRKKIKGGTGIISHIIFTGRELSESRSPSLFDTTYINFFGWFTKLEMYLAPKYFELNEYMKNEIILYEEKNSLEPRTKYIRDDVFERFRLCEYKEDINNYIINNYNTSIEKNEKFKKELIKKTREKLFTFKGFLFVINNSIYLFLSSIYSVQLEKNINRIEKIFGVRVKKDIEAEEQLESKLESIENILRNTYLKIESLEEYTYELNIEIEVEKTKNQLNDIVDSLEELYDVVEKTDEWA